MDPMLLMVVPMIAIFYFLIMRPQKKQRQQMESLRESLQVGDKITTIGGIVGKIVQVREDYITFETGEDRVRIQVIKSAIANKGVANEEPKEIQNQ